MADEVDRELEAIGARIRLARKEAGLSGSGLARLAGLAHSHISEVERGRRNPSWRILSTLFEHFQVSPSWIATGEGPRVVEADLERSGLQSFARDILRTIGRHPDLVRTGRADELVGQVEQLLEEGDQARRELLRLFLAGLMREDMSSSRADASDAATEQAS